MLADQSLDDIIAELKAGKSRYELKHGCWVEGNKAKAQDPASKLVYLLLRGDVQDEHEIAAKMFGVVLYVVSHSGTLTRRARTVV